MKGAAPIYPVALQVRFTAEIMILPLKRVIKAVSLNTDILRKFGVHEGGAEAGN